MTTENGQCLEVFFDQHFDDVYGYVAYRLAPNFEAAKDVTQDVFLAALEGWSAYRGKGSVLSWLRAIARHKIADHLRLRMDRPCESNQEALSQLTNSDDGPGQRALLLAQVMRMLPVEYVELLEEKYLDGLSVRQMAKKRGRTEKAIESALSRSRHMVRSELRRLEQRQEHSDEPSIF